MLAAHLCILPEQVLALQRLTHVYAAPQCRLAFGHHLQQFLCQCKSLAVVLLFCKRMKAVCHHLLVSRGVAVSVCRVSLSSLQEQFFGFPEPVQTCQTDDAH